MWPSRGDDDGEEASCLPITHPTYPPSPLPPRCDTQRVSCPLRQVGDRPLAVAVSSAAINPLFFDDVDPELLPPNRHRRRLQPQSCEVETLPVPHPYNAYSTVLTPPENGTAARALESAWAVLVRDPAPLLPHLPHACGVEITIIKALSTPPLPRFPAFRPLGTELALGPSVTVVRAGDLVPAGELGRGDRCTVWLNNFPPRSTVVLQLLGGMGRNASSAVKVPNFPQEAEVEMEWDVPPWLPAGVYYFKAFPQAHPFFVGFSRTFEVPPE
jgi:hypothetical protein